MYTTLYNVLYTVLYIVLYTEIKVACVTCYYSLEKLMSLLIYVVLNTA